MNLRETFGQYIRRLRELKKLPIRRVAAELDIDPSTLSKIERGERPANREQVQKLSIVFGIDLHDLEVLFLSDQITYQLMQEDNYHEVLEAAEMKIKYLRSKSIKQGKLNI